MIRIFPDFSVQVTASATGGVGSGGGGGGAAGMVTGPPVGRVPVPVPGASNGTPQGMSAYQQSDPYWERPSNTGSCSTARPKTLHLAGQQHTSSPWLQALRKEKSRDAARSRRGKENFEFYELAKMLPLPGAITSQLDKASIIRLTISYLKMRDFANQGDPPWNLRIEGPPPNTSVKAIGTQRRRTPSAIASEIFEPHLGSHILQSLDGFVFALNKEGRFLYISETVSIYLGLSQVELTGSSVFDYVHPGDHVEMAEQLGMKLPPGRGMTLSQGVVSEDGASSASSSSHSETPEPVESSSPSLLSPDNSLERSFFIRMKSTLTKRGVHIKSSGYKVIHVTGRLRIRMALTHSRSVPNQIMGMVVVAHALPPPTINEVRIDCQMFVTRVNMDLKIVYCENRISDYMDLTPVDIVGKRCYQFIHAEDVEGIRQSHLDLMNKGQCVTKYYRWIQKNGGYIWIQSSATIAINAKNSSEKNIIWVNYVLSNPEYKDTPIDIAQLPNLPEKASESSETSDSESDSKENSDNENAKSEGKTGHQAEHREDPETESKRQQQPGQSHCPSEEKKDHDEGDSSSNPESQDSDDSLEPTDGEQEQEVSRGEGGGLESRLGRLSGLGALEGLNTISGLGHFGGLHIKVEHYGEGEEELHGSQISSSEEEEDEEDGDADEVEDRERQRCDDAGSGSKLQKRRKRRKVQKWDGSRSRRLRMSATPPSPVAIGDSTPQAHPSGGTSVASTQLLASSDSPNSTEATSSVLKIKTEMAEPINFDNDSSIWNYPPNREISRNESPYSMTSKPSGPGSQETFPSPQGGSLQVAIPDSVLTPPGPEGAAGGLRKLPYNGNSTSSSSLSATSLAPPSNSSSADPLSPPLSASPRDKQQGTPTTSSISSSSATSSSSSSLLYSGDLEALQRLQAGNVVLPLVHRVTGSLSSTSTTAPRVYTTGTIRYAPADVTLAMAQGNLLPNAAMNFVESSGFGLDPKTPMEMLYHHVHRLNMSAAAAGGPFVGSPAPTVGNGTLGGHMSATANVFTTAEGLFSTLPFPVYSNGIHTTQTMLERKEDQ
ncbi:LOW QUALITY PROTEIN: neuronal PAS domain-containing protein 3 [Cyprinodon tularosa]|uniref:LOW QUALITY PROTEIN: neuronal PAS domain-containing protein 3 n=1 Tax=Cyprinodon tularosa TaxID=77115 RepID=UPI0018E273A6|nr:LOW QUALITY PROTEIN: neuronal PAS domain-containing protein 3 [Cyprinodon tularosa]